jgi:replication initiation and membrane attachment protein DnaB
MFRGIQSEMERMFEDLRFDFDAFTKELVQEMVFKAIQQRLQDNG